MKKKLLFGLIITLAGCASYHTQNEISHSDLSFKGGVMGERKWDDALIFKRTSWYQGATLSYDFLIVELEQGSKFSLWLDPSEREYHTKCEKLYIGLVYSNDTSPVAYAKLTSQLEDYGLSRVFLPGFSSQVKSHFAYNEWHFEDHQISGFCQKAGPAKAGPLAIILPGFSKVKVL